METIHCPKCNKGAYEYEWSVNNPTASWFTLRCPKCDELIDIDQLTDRGMDFDEIMDQVYIIIEYTERYIKKHGDNGARDAIKYLYKMIYEKAHKAQ